MKYKPEFRFISLNALSFCAGLSLSSALFAGVTPRTVDPLTTTAQPSTENPLNKDLCSPEVNLICGEQYVNKQISDNCQTKETFESRVSSSDTSEHEGYNLSTFMNNQGKDYRNFCVNKAILDNPAAGYSMDQLDGLQLAGAIKVKLMSTGEILYVPFRSSELKKRKDKSNSKETVYRFSIFESDNPLELFTDTKLGYAAARHLAKKKSVENTLIPLRMQVNRLAQNTDNKMKKEGKDMGLPEPHIMDPYFPRINSDLSLVSVPETKVTMTLTRSEWFAGKTYDINITSWIPFPAEAIKVRFTSGGTARFAKPHYKNFRRDSNYYSRGISLTPNPNSIEQGHHIGQHYKLIEIILMPPMPELSKFATQEAKSGN
ncbi:hypothetical protein [Endozoicomonas euniceicola]|uniref:Uncharacterized protein n=1 Tax=Endozoicomonas euniceicola TaxID=1234143 RepID=A0ABY6GUJ6_9GAMM|nr:hypothetical protein [Endozoicomonas euniceicola]UYM16450.1 hypothetical protein NX720_00505 [Endozoicomonas euniceicola]